MSITLYNRINILGFTRIFLVGLLAVSLSGCFSTKQSTSKGGKNLYATFYTEDGLQYFLKPMSFKSDNNEELLIDFTFRNVDIKTDSATVNFTTIGSQLIKSIEDIRIAADANVEAVGVNPKLLFNEKKSKGYSSRFTTKFSLYELSQVLNQNTSIIISYKQNTYAYKAEKKTKKSIASLNDVVFSLIFND